MSTPPQTPSQRKKPQMGLFASGLIIAVSFTAMLMPLAIFHLAQVGAAMREKSAYILLFSAIFSLLFLGYLTQTSIFLFGGITGLIWSPAVVTALHFRLKGKSPVIPSVLFFAPTFILCASLLSLPIKQDLSSYLDTRKNEYLQTLDTLATSPLSTSIKRGESLSPEQIASEKASLESAFTLLKSMPEFDIMSKVAAQGPMGRLGWLVFGDGSRLLMICILIALGNIIFLDFGVTQIERLKSVVLYVAENASSFPNGMTAQIRGLPLLMKPSHASLVTTAQRIPQNPPGGWRGFLLIPKSWVNKVLLGGFLFSIDEKSDGWRTSRMRMPFALVISAVAILFSVAFWKGQSAESLFASLPLAQGLAFALVCLFSFIVGITLMVQGLLTSYLRLSPIIVISSLVGAYLLGGMVPSGPWLLMAFFGSVGLLDYAYDLRGHLAKKSKAV